MTAILNASTISASYGQLTCPIMNGNITNSTFCVFLATNSAAQTFTKGAPTQLTLDTEIFDQGNNFASNVFTAPVTGKYHFIVNFGLNAALNATTDTYVMLATTAASILLNEHNPTATTAGTDTWSYSSLVQMTAGDTAQVKIFGAGGTSTFASYRGDNLPRFGGFLVC